MEKMNCLPKEITEIIIKFVEDNLLKKYKLEHKNKYIKVIKQYNEWAEEWRFLIDEGYFL